MVENSLTIKNCSLSFEVTSLVVIKFHWSFIRPTYKIVHTLNAKYNIMLN